MPDQIEEALRHARTMTPDNFKILLLRLLQEAGPYSPFFPGFGSIVKTPGVCGGSARLIRTRIPVWSVEQMRRDGVADDDILAGHPTLTAEDLLAAGWYARMFREEIDQEIEGNERGFDGQAAPR